MSIVAMLPDQSMTHFLLMGLATPTQHKAARRGRPPKQQVCQERGGWGATVAPNLRYIYSSRTGARNAKITDEIGQNGRTA